MKKEVPIVPENITMMNTLHHGIQAINRCEGIPLGDRERGNELLKRTVLLVVQTGKKCEVVNRL